MIRYEYTQADCAKVYLSFTGCGDYQLKNRMTRKKAMSSEGFEIENSARGARTLPLRQGGKIILAKKYV